MVTGTPGTGKTTLSRLLSNRMRARHVELSAYAQSHGHVLSRDVERDTVVVDVDRLRQEIDWEMKVSGEKFILDGHYSHDLLEPGNAAVVFVLRKAPWVLEETLRSRGYREPKVRENVEAEIIGVCSAEALGRYPPEKVCELDTTGSTDEETVEKMLRRIGGEDVCDGPVDWLNRLETMELLKRIVLDS